MKRVPAMAELVQAWEHAYRRYSAASEFAARASRGGHGGASALAEASWSEVVEKKGLKGLHFHDLRHAGNIWASKAGISTKDLMARMGHDDMRAALIYQRATSDADQQIADRLSKLVDRHRKGVEPEDDEGEDGLPVPVG
jgi:integrase